MDRGIYWELGTLTSGEKKPEKGRKGENKGIPAGGMYNFGKIFSNRQQCNSPVKKEEIYGIL